jgi:hypothetical protein
MITIIVILIIGFGLFKLIDYAIYYDEWLGKKNKDK